MSVPTRLRLDGDNKDVEVSIDDEGMINIESMDSFVVVTRDGVSDLIHAMQQLLEGYDRGIK